MGWHHRTNGHEFEQALGDSERQGSLVCCSPWSHKESDMSEWLNNSNNFIVICETTDNERVKRELCTLIYSFLLLSRNLLFTSWGVLFYNHQTHFLGTISEYITCPFYWLCQKDTILNKNGINILSSEVIFILKWIFVVFFFLCWAPWTVCILWRLILCLQIFLPILRAVFLPF